MIIIPPTIPGIKPMLISGVNARISNACLYDDFFNKIKNNNDTM